MNNIINYNNVLKKFYFTEKLSFISKVNNVVILKVNKDCNKFQIISAFEKIFNIKILKIRTLNIKKIILNKKKKTNKIIIWKKAYIFLNKNDDLKLNDII